MSGPWVQILPPPPITIRRAGMRSSLIADIIYDLLGTCQTLDQACLTAGIEESELTLEELAAIDEEIFCCEDCGWWYERCEEGHDGICSDCC